MENKTNLNLRVTKDVVGKVVDATKNYIKIQEMNGDGEFTDKTIVIFAPYEQDIPEYIEVEKIVALTYRKERYWSKKYNEWKTSSRYIGSIDVLS